MARYDKYEPHVGGFRAPLAAAVAQADGYTVFGVGLDVDGHVVIGDGTSGTIGVLIAHGAKNAGDIVDVMTSGEIVDFTVDGTPGGSAAAAGTKYAVGTDGSVGTTGTSIGFTVEPTRLIVRVQSAAAGGGV